MSSSLGAVVETTISVVTCELKALVIIIGFVVGGAGEGFRIDDSSAVWCVRKIIVEALGAVRGFWGSRGCCCCCAWLGWLQRCLTCSPCCCSFVDLIETNSVCCLDYFSVGFSRACFFDLWHQLGAFSADQPPVWLVASLYESEL